MPPVEQPRPWFARLWRGTDGTLALYLGEQLSEKAAEFHFSMAILHTGGQDMPGYLLVQQDHTPYRIWVRIDSIDKVTFEKGSKPNYAP